MNLLLRLLLFTLLLITNAVHAQIGISGAAHSSAALDVKSPGNDKAFYPPRLTTAQRLAIPNPQAGAFVYDLDKGTMYLHNGQNWFPMVTAAPEILPPVSWTADDGSRGDSFGISVAISGDYAIIGAHGKTINNNVLQGAAYIFSRKGNSWTQQQRLVVADGATYDFFGRSVGISGDYAVVGASGKAINGVHAQGAAYVFSRSGTVWTMQQRILAIDGAEADNFGESVAISGDYIIVGAPNKAVNNRNQQGAAYIFSRLATTWTQQQKLIAADGAVLDLLGISVAISGEYAVAGASGKNVNGMPQRGAAYVFYRSGESWTQQRLTANNGANGDEFGKSVAIDANYIIVGAPLKSIGNNQGQGAAHVFERSGANWTERQMLTTNGASYDFFGQRVAVSANYIIVGAYQKRVNDIRLGAAYTYMRNSMNTNWSIQREVLDKSTEEAANGASVGISNGTFVIGGPSYLEKGKVTFGVVD